MCETFKIAELLDDNLEDPKVVSYDEFTQQDFVSSKNVVYKNERAGATMASFGFESAGTNQENGNPLWAKLGIHVHGDGYDECEILEEIVDEQTDKVEFKRLWLKEGVFEITQDAESGVYYAVRTKELSKKRHIAEFYSVQKEGELILSKVQNMENVLPSIPNAKQMIDLGDRGDCLPPVLTPIVLHKGD